MKIWHGCYDSSWNGFITPESFSHPAKFARGLIERIFDHCLERGYLKRGDRVGDAFGGIGTGGIIAAYRGIAWIGCELESRFVTMAQANFARHESKWAVLGSPRPQIIQGDSRRFDEIIGGIEFVVSSPPYAANEKCDYLMSEDGKTRRRDQYHTQGRGCFRGSETYGTTPGQIGSLKSGTLDAVVSSPPYADSIDRPSCIDTGKVKKVGGLHSQQNHDIYGQTPGQIGRCKSGSLDAVVSSPPWEKNDDGGIKGHKLNFVPTNGKGHYATEKAKAAQLARDEQKVYGSSNGQIGQERGETYWQAVSQVYQGCYRAIRPGGFIVLVVKDYVSKGKRVPLCDDTARLLEHCGFTVIERVHAMLTQETRHADLFHGETVETKSRKSFFRRLCESKGSPEINWEEVIFTQKPL